MEDIIAENYFTVEGEVVKRQEMSNFHKNSQSNNFARERKMQHFLTQEAHRQKYKLFEELMKNEGHEAGIDFFFDEKHSWLSKFANYQWPVLTGISNNWTEKDTMFVMANVDQSILEFRHVHLVGHISHHYFGILGNYLTTNVLNLNSAVIASKRTAIGNPKNPAAHISFSRKHTERVLNHYQITDIDQIREAMRFFRATVAHRKNLLAEDGDGEDALSEEVIKSVEREIRKKNEGDFMNEKIDYERDYNEKLKLELVKTVNILDFAETYPQYISIKSSQRG